MAIIVEKIESGERYILVGAGFAAYESARPSAIFGNLLPSEKQGTLGMIAVCDSEGNISWIEHQALRVIEIGGFKPGQIRSKQPYRLQ